MSGALTRRYHGLLVAALAPPLGRTLLVAKLDETLAYDGRSVIPMAMRSRSSSDDRHGHAD